MFSSDPGKQYDMREMIARIVDGSEFEEYRAEYGKTLSAVTPASAAGPSEIVANKKKHVQTVDAATGERGSNSAV